MNFIDQIIHTTVRIECVRTNGDRASGTGFICAFSQRDDRHVPAIVTNKHVVRGATVGLFHMTTADENGGPNFGDYVSVPVKDFEARFVQHPDDDVDLAVFPIAGVVDWMARQGKTAFYRHIGRHDWADSDFMNQLSAVEEIVMVGYPNGLWDSKNNLPIVRRGITATPPYIDFEGKPQFMIDCACFGGSSGSPVYLANTGGYAAKEGGLVIGQRFKLLGVLWGGPQYTAEGEIVVVPVPSAVQPVALSRIPNNLGYCVRADQLLWFETHFEALVDAEIAAKAAQGADAA